MKQYKVTNVEWETDGEDVDLPQSFVIELDDECNPRDEMADAISDKYGWLINGCSYELVEDPVTAQLELGGPGQCQYCDERRDHIKFHEGVCGYRPIVCWDLPPDLK